MAGSTLRFHLTTQEAARLMEPARGAGGFQSFFRKLQAKLDPNTNVIELDDTEVGRIVRLISYEPGGFEDRLRDAFRRSLRNCIG